MIKATRIVVPVVEPVEDANIICQYAIQKAAWIWHPDFRVTDKAMLIFRNVFILKRRQSFLLHVSGDQRYELFINSQRISCGPDRSDLWHWSFASYRVTLDPGRYKLEGIVWWIGDKAPGAQISRQGGFILAAEGPLAAVLTTGKGAWQVAESRGWSYERKYQDPGVYHVVGPAFEIDGRQLYGRPLILKKAVVVAPPLVSGTTGVAAPGWQLFPSHLPDQVSRVRSPGKIRAVALRKELGTVRHGDILSPEVRCWQQLIDGAALTVPAHTTCQVVWDLEDYYCGYEEILVDRGRDARISLEWAESLFASGKAGTWSRPKGNRNEVLGKYFIGFGLHVTTDGGPRRIYCAPWWHSGRYLVASVRTAAQPLVIRHLGFRETRYPLENRSMFRSADLAADAVIPLAVRGIQMCSHETLTDCPFYEQMMYVGDTRVQMLVTSTMTTDDRLIRRGIQLFDWSRWKTGFVAERYPSHRYQSSLTFAMIWVLMLNDYARWHNDPAWVQQRMTGMRTQFINFQARIHADGLLRALPGWSFMDWVPGWDTGYPPEATAGRPSAIVNLLFIYSLQRAAELEDWHGQPEYAALFRQTAARVAAAVKRVFWKNNRSLIADDAAGKHFSEHAQCLVLLTGLLSSREEQRCFQALITAPNLARTTVYFSFYLFEVFYKFKRGDLIRKKLDDWKFMVRQGFRTPLEAPEPSRSDCHAWGAHPLYHMHASLAGVRPMAPGFRQVRIEPAPGGLEHLESKLPHPNGFIETRLRCDHRAGRCTAWIKLPSGVTGVFVWRGKKYKLAAGKETVVKA
jgi:hypothetical protein